MENTPHFQVVPGTPDAR